METPKIRSQLDKLESQDDLTVVTNRAKKVLGLTGYNLIKPIVEKGVNEFPSHGEVYWTDAGIDASGLEGRKEIARALGIELSDIVSFTAVNHTDEVVIVESANGIKKFEKVKNPKNGEVTLAGWSEVKVPHKIMPSSAKAKRAERGAYDGLILIGRENFEGKYLLATGADCTPIGLRGELSNGQEFIAIAHGGRQGTMTEIMENMAKRLLWLGVDVSSLEVFVGPAAQAIEVPVSLLEEPYPFEKKKEFAKKKSWRNFFRIIISVNQKKEKKEEKKEEEIIKEAQRVKTQDDNSWRVASISAEYEKNEERKVLYNNQFDSIRRLVESLNLKPEQVHLIDADTVSEDNRGKLHSFRRDKTPARNSLVIGFSKKV